MTKQEQRLDSEEIEVSFPFGDRSNKEEETKREQEKLSSQVDALLTMISQLTDTISVTQDNIREIVSIQRRVVEHVFHEEEDC